MINSTILLIALTTIQAAGYPVCSAEGESYPDPEIAVCYDTVEFSGYFNCNDKDAAPTGNLFHPHPHPGRFYVFDSASVVGDPPSASGRYDEIVVLRTDGGVAYATVFVYEKDWSDGFEPIERNGNCWFTRFLPQP